jgi:hypothetical protein
MEQTKQVGDAVVYVDEYGKPRDALITAIHGKYGENPINVVYLADDVAKSDPYGRQVERASSVQVEGPTAAHGRFYRV